MTSQATTGGGASSGRGLEDSRLRKLLEALAAGHLSVEEVLSRLRLFSVAQVGDFARLDPFRDLRRAIPEVIYAPGKSDHQLEAIVRACLEQRGCALVARADPQRGDKLRTALGIPHELDQPSLTWDGWNEAVSPASGLMLRSTADGRALAFYASSYVMPREQGCVGVLTAGTSDIPVAEEAALVIWHMGCRVERAFDVGVAALHRLVEPLTQMLECEADVLVVVAGMEGALPSVVAGLVDLPVIGVPTSTGYGLGGDGTAALYAMLQSCSLGLLTVNVDNGVGAGAAAALIARRACGRRSE